MDFAFHEDVIPFNSPSFAPIWNEYFKDFFVKLRDRHVGTDVLHKWVELRRESLEVSTIHREETEGIEVTTVPFLMGRRTVRWRYLIRLKSNLKEPVQLRERFWKIFSITGSLESVKGNGVVGVQPVMSKANPIFQYHSHVHVQVPWAHMWGTYRFERRSGTCFDVKIPAFPLCDREDWTDRPEFFMNANDGHPPDEKP